MSLGPPDSPRFQFECLKYLCSLVRDGGRSESDGLAVRRRMRDAPPPSGTEPGRSLSRDPEPESQQNQQQTIRRIFLRSHSSAALGHARRCTRFAPCPSSRRIYSLQLFAHSYQMQELSTFTSSAAAGACGHVYIEDQVATEYGTLWLHMVACNDSTRFLVN